MATLHKKDIHTGALVLVNAQHPFVPVRTQSLTAVLPSEADIKMQRQASGILRQLLRVVDPAGRIFPVSGYRSREEQTDIYQQALAEGGEQYTAQYVALPGHSEHQTGLAIDLATEKTDDICPPFPYTGVCGTFRQKGLQYGFIERYSRGKEKITGIAHEPWHFRYVGYPHAQVMAENNFCLEEYIDFLRNHPLTSNPLQIAGEHRVKTGFIPCPGDTALIPLPKHQPWQISGNNVDGFIATIWEGSHAS